MLGTSAEGQTKFSCWAHTSQRLLATAKAFFSFPPACNVAELHVRAKTRPRPRGPLAGEAGEPQWATLTLKPPRLVMAESSLRVRRQETASHSSLTRAGAGAAPCNDSAALSCGSSIRVAAHNFESTVGEPQVLPYHHMEGSTSSAQSRHGAGIGGLRQPACHCSCPWACSQLLVGIWAQQDPTSAAQKTILCLSCAVHNAGAAVGPCST